MSRRHLALLLLVCLACGGAETKSPATDSRALDDTTPRDGGRLVRRLDIDVTTLNPIVSTSRADRYVTQYLFTPLIHIDRDLQPVPGLADSWEISKDGLLYRFFLDKKATFSDGTPVKAADVIFTLTKIIDPKSEAVQVYGAFEQLDRARTRAVDDHTVEVAFRQPLASQLLRFNDVLILPQHIYSKGDFRADFNSTAVGSGPYRLVRRVPGQEIVIERRGDYPGQKPRIQTVVFKVIGDHGVALNALRRGEIDETPLTADAWLRERENPAATRTIDFQRFYTLNYNYIAWNGRHPILADKRVRRALAMCIPIERVITDLYHGTARAMTGPFTPDEWAYNPAVPVIRYDPGEARRLLAEAGWKDSDGDGVLDRDGRPFKFSLQVMTGSATARQIAQIAQAELKNIGATLDIVVVDGTAGIQRLMEGNYDAAYLSWDLDPDPDPYALFHSTQTYAGGGQNFVFYSNPEVDRLIEAARRELDQSKRKDMYWRVHEILAEEQPYLWVVQVSLKWGVNRRVRNVTASRGTGYFLWYPGELDWWIAPRR